jgi:hypothetical protein
MEKLGRTRSHFGLLVVAAMFGALLGFLAGRSIHLASRVASVYTPPVLESAPVELYLKAGRTPFDVNSVYLKTGKPFRAALKYRTDLYLITGQVCT